MTSFDTERSKLPNCQYNFVLLKEYSKLTDGIFFMVMLLITSTK